MILRLYLLVFLRVADLKLPRLSVPAGSLRELVAIATDGLIENTGLDAVDLGKIRVQDDTFAADGVDDAVNRNGGKMLGGHASS